MTIDKVQIGRIKVNPDNPRIIKDDKFTKLVQSLKDFPEMANVRPIVVNTDYIVLGGNMRLKAMQDAGWKEVPVQVVDWPEDKQREFIIKDNVGFGEWNWDQLANEWDAEELSDWGVDIWKSEVGIDNGDENEDLSTFAESADKYLNNQVRQILLTFDIETHKKTLDRLYAVQVEYNINEDNSAAVLKLLELYERNKNK